MAADSLKDDAAFADDAVWSSAEKQRELLDACGAELHAALSDAETLSRFLIARKGVVADARKMLLRHQRWRAEECP
jgi:hypothetical protein